MRELVAKIRPRRASRRSATWHPQRPGLQSEKLLPTWQALPVMGARSIATVAYVPDQILLFLSVVGTAHIASYIAGIATVLLAVMVVVVAAYRQVVHAYPRAGSDYDVVAKNLGPEWGALSAAAILIDYVLTVALSLSTLALYLGHLIPAIAEWRVLVAVAAAMILAVGNLRVRRAKGRLYEENPENAWATTGLGVKIAAGSVYGFALLLVAILSFAFLTQCGHDAPPGPATVERMTVTFGGTQALLGLGTTLMVAKALSMGAGFFGGVNSCVDIAPTLRRPKAQMATRALLLSGLLTAAALLAVVLVARMQGFAVSKTSPPLLLAPLLPVDTVSAWWVVPAVIIVATVLVVAASRTFGGFSRLLLALARDSQLPRQLHQRGDRVTTPTAAILIGVCASVVIVVTGADLGRLIALYAFGVCMTLPLTQAAMIAHWNRHLRTAQTGAQRKKVLRSRAVNIVALITVGTAFALVLVTTSADGAWMLLVLLAIMTGLQTLIRRNYLSVARDYNVLKWQANPAADSKAKVLVLATVMPHIFIRMVQKCPPPPASSTEFVVVVTDRKEEEAVLEQWRRVGEPIALTMLYSPMRDTVGVLTSHVHALRAAAPKETLVVYLPQVLVRHWWDNALYNRTARGLRRVLDQIPGVVIAHVTWKTQPKEGAK